MGSTIRRGKLPTDHFTIISNEWIRDAALSWSARGVLCWLASHSNGFEVTEAAIVAAGPVGRAGVRSALQELENAGYLRRDRTSVATGGSTVDYALTDPGECENRTPPSVRKSHPRPDQGKHAREEESSQVSPNVGKSNPRSLLEEQEKTIGETASPRAAASEEIIDGEIVNDGALIPRPVGAALDVVDSPNAGVLTRRWIDHCASGGVKLTSTSIKRYASQIKQALADGFDDKLIRHALAAMLADRVASRPALLDTYLIRVQQGPELPPARLKPHQADAERRAAEAGTTAAARLYDTLTRDA